MLKLPFQMPKLSFQMPELPFQMSKLSFQMPARTPFSISNARTLSLDIHN
jgi:hypothetical protein